MWVDEKKKAPIIDYLGWILFLSVFFELLMLILEPASINNAETGKLSFSYVMYAAIGILFTTPGPVIALFILLRKEEKITVKEFIKRFLYTPKKIKTVLITGLFCLCALLFAIFCGELNGSPLYMMPLGFLIMLPFVGFAEETGWRGFLQPMLEKRFPFPVATTIVAVIWCVWHFPIWLQPTSNHYGDSMIGFAINIFVWAFVAAAIYKSTKSVLACAIYHSFINSIGAIYDWNKLFDSYPNSNTAYIYFGIIFIAALVIWYKEDREAK
ncbi:CPBP family intramembrane glutamic endopeptidase [Butyrivibrio sp. AD3002]|uniref:CPBP family intramembrane glutamic endopeptidase n=1 Tax=Butyrivibrio sp. AD3002 TaxID=1280670 RepID=UPI0003B705B1|nr:CPBP family intramembrane glutamic endopeptidase [Butyrivibrio sp. AD3002]